LLSYAPTQFSPGLPREGVRERTSTSGNGFPHICGGKTQKQPVHFSSDGIIPTHVS